jgi:hypothetical protein
LLVTHSKAPARVRSATATSSKATRG